MRDAAGGIIPGEPRQPAVQHHPHALNGQAGFSDGGGEHHLSRTIRGRLNGEVLTLGIHSAIERRNDDVVREPVLQQSLLDPVDLSLSGQEDENGTRFGLQDASDDPRHLIFETQVLVTTDMMGHDRPASAFALDHRRAPQQS